ncbi:HU family DNA-binding protein [Devosia honganensis]|uniref:HU family DNA-binding protein n=1 Tax=Devosia honganensis TaxID=1610527 RepID=A0ABV7X358_9HYPH
MGKTVTRVMLNEHVAEATGSSRHDVSHIAQRMFELIRDTLMQGQSVKLTGFGSLQVRDRAERVGRNPRNGDRHRIAPHRTVILIPSGHLRRSLERKPLHRPAGDLPGDLHPH